MLLRLLICVQLVLLASLAMPVPPAFAQREDLNIVEQPGMVPKARIRRRNSSAR